MLQTRKKLVGVLAAIAVFAVVAAAWVFWPRPIEGYWDDIGIPCLCGGCKFLYFKDGRVYQYHEEHGVAQYWGQYTKVSPGVYRFTFDAPGTATITICVYGLISCWTEGDMKRSTTSWRLFDTSKARQLVDTFPIRTSDGKKVTPSIKVPK
jgi:hypothetical protein